MERIERPLRLHRDREHRVVSLAHLDPQLPRSCRQSSRTHVPFDERSASSRVFRRTDGVACSRALPSWPGGLLSMSLSFGREPTTGQSWFSHTQSIRGAAAASPATGEKIREFATGTAKVAGLLRRRRISPRLGLESRRRVRRGFNSRSEVAQRPAKATVLAETATVSRGCTPALRKRDSSAARGLAQRSRRGRAAAAS